MGYKIAVYPLTLLNVSIKAMREALIALREERTPPVLPFNELTEAVGFMPITPMKIDINNNLAFCGLFSERV